MQKFIMAIMLVMCAFCAYAELDSSIAGTSACWRRLYLNDEMIDEDGTCQSATLSYLGNINNQSGKWGTVFSYGDVSGRSVCSATNGTRYTSATEVQSAELDSEYNTQAGQYKNLSNDQRGCWCKADMPGASDWLFLNWYGASSNCGYACASACANDFKNAISFRSSLLGTILVYAENNSATSKEYVDAGVAEKQPTVPAAGANNVMTYDSSATNGIGTKGIYDATGDYASQQNALVTAATANAAVQMAINGEFVCHEWNPDNSNDCWLWKIKEPVAPSRNLFDPSRVPHTFYYGRGINNGDGTFTITAMNNNSYYETGKKLSQLVPDLIVGKKYTLSFTTTATNKTITLAQHSAEGGVNVVANWRSGTSMVMTEELLDANFAFQATTGATTTISNIQIEEGTTATPYQPYGQNTFLPQNVQ